jgi:ABC-type nitrate/sulfonate/bicarbonate transport system substrate-binding protein
MRTGSLTAWSRRRPLTLVALACLSVLAGSGRAGALDSVRVGKSAATTLAFAPVEIGTAQGTWARHGLDVTSIAFAGDARMQQGMVANAIDLALGSGPGMGFLARGVPAKAVAAIANEPLSMGLSVGKNSRLAAPQDLKGAKIGVSTQGSLTFWLTRELSRQMGWGPAGMTTVALGTNQALVAALRTAQVDGIVLASSVGYALEKIGEGRVLVEFGRHVKDFHTHVIQATDDVIARRPDVIRRFLLGWTEVVAFMATHKAETVKLLLPITELPGDVQIREYDGVMPMMSRDLRFQPKALAALARSFVELDILPAEPDMTTLYTEQFLPK